MKLYLDGKLAASVQDDSSLPDDLFVSIGGPDNDQRVRRFIGRIDELAVYDWALTEGEIQRHFNAVDWASSEQTEASRIDGI